MASTFINLPASGGGTGSQTERERILAGSDLTKNITWLNYGTADERIHTVEYTSSDVPGRKLVKTITWSVGSPYVFLSSSEEVVNV